MNHLSTKLFVALLLFSIFSSVYGQRFQKTLEDSKGYSHTMGQLIPERGGNYRFGGYSNAGVQEELKLYLYWPTGTNSRSVVYIDSIFKGGVLDSVIIRYRQYPYQGDPLYSGIVPVDSNTFDPATTRWDSMKLVVGKDYDLLSVQLDGNLEVSLSTIIGTPCFEQNAFYNTPDPTYLITQTSDDHFILGASYQCFYGGGSDLALTKIDAGNNILWAKKYDLGPYDLLQQIISTSDNGALVADKFGWENTVLMKINSSGNKEWAFNFTVDNQHIPVIRYLLEDKDGNFLVLGERNSEVPGPQDLGNRDAVLFKIDSNGNLLWAKNYEIGNNSQLVYTIKEAGNDAYFISGANYNPAREKRTALIIKVNNQGVPVWTREFVIHNDDLARTTVRKGTHEAWVCGTTDHSTQFTGNNNTGSDYFLFKLNDLGFPTKQVYFSHPLDDKIYDLVLGQDGNPILDGLSKDQSRRFWVKVDDSGDGPRCYQRPVDPNVISPDVKVSVPVMHRDEVSPTTTSLNPEKQIIKHRTQEKECPDCNCDTDL